MKFKKFSLITIVTMLLLTMVGAPVSASAKSNTDQGLSQEEKEIVEIVLGHFENYTNTEGNVQVKIINEKDLENKLNESDVELSFEQLQSAVENFNYYMNEGDNLVTDTADDIANQLESNTSNGMITTYAITCSDALSAMGHLHSGSYAAAARLLGLSTGPAGIIIPLLVDAAYTIGAELC